MQLCKKRRRTVAGRLFSSSIPLLFWMQVAAYSIAVPFFLWWIDLPPSILARVRSKIDDPYL
jgi:hypothetical protein